MEDKKYLQKLIEMAKIQEIDTCRDVNFNEKYSSFEGTPRKHPTDKNILVLLTNPFSKNKAFYEFSIDSIGNIEDLGTITNEDGTCATRVRIWVKRGMPALKAEPFIIK